MLHMRGACVQVWLTLYSEPDQPSMGTDQWIFQSQQLPPQSFLVYFSNFLPKQNLKKEREEHELISLKGAKRTLFSLFVRWHTPVAISSAHRILCPRGLVSPILFNDGSPACLLFYDAVCIQGSLESFLKISQLLCSVVAAVFVVAIITDLLLHSSDAHTSRLRRSPQEQVELAEHASDYSRSERAPTAAYTVFQFLIKRLSFSSPPPLPPLADIIIMAWVLRLLSTSKDPSAAVGSLCRSPRFTRLLPTHSASRRQQT